MKAEAPNRPSDHPGSPGRPRIGLVIPLYNHGSTVAGVVKEAAGLGWPVFLVNDGSTDDPPLTELAGIPGVKVLDHPANRGKGASLMTGFKEAAGKVEWALTIDADGQHRAGEAVRLAAAIPPSGKPIILGRRTGMTRETAPWGSRFGRKFSNFWVWAASGRKLKDSQSGFRLYPLPETLELRPKARRFQFEVEVLALAAWAGMEILEVPVSVVYQPPGERISHFRPWSDFWRNASTFTRLIVRRVLVPKGRRRGG